MTEMSVYAAPNKHKPLRLALFLPSLCGGGAERSIVNLARELASEGLSVDLVLARAEGPYLSVVPEGVRVVDLRAPRMMAALPGLVRYLRREEPTALLSALDHANLVALWARSLARARTRVVVSVRGMRSHGQLCSRWMKERWVPAVARRFYPLADAIVAVSHGAAEDLARGANGLEERISVIYNPVLTTDLAALAAAPVGHAWFEPGAPPVILSAGRLAKVKNFRALIEAFARLRQQRQARLMILGEGEERERLEALVRNLDLAADVALPGFANNPFAYMARARVFALTSFSEGLPGVLIQAMACGCPIVATDCPGGVREILRDGELGLLVPVGDVGAMAAALGTALEAPVPTSNLKARAADFSADLIARKYLAILLPDGIRPGGVHA
jgi:glycosyltransferase involved in cell wall biosynthesis